MVEPYRTPQMGSGLPPFNSTGNPPINLAFLVNCGSGANEEFLKFCFPYENAYGPWLENQAFIGFTPSINISDEFYITVLFIVPLADGYTVNHARAEVLTQADPPIRSFPSGSDPGHELTVTDMPIYGDRFTRIRSVYTGNDIAPVGWFLP